MDLEKKTALLLLSVLVVFIAVQFFALSLAEQSLRNAFIENAVLESESKTQRLATLLEVEFRNLKEKLFLLSKRPEIVSGNSEECFTVLNESRPLLADSVGSLSRLRPNGVFDCSTIPSVVGSNHGNTFNELLLNPVHPAMLTGVTYYEFTDKYVASLQVPIFDESGGFRGGIGGAIQVSDIQNKYFRNVSLLANSSALILDFNGDILYSEESDVIGKNILDPEIGVSEVELVKGEAVASVLDDVFSGGSGSVIYAFEGEEFIAAYSPARILPEREWIVIVITPVASVLEVLGTRARVFDTEAFFNLFTVTSILALLSVLSLAYYLRVNVFAPINAFTRNIDEVSRADLDLGIDERFKHAGNELGRLARALDRLIVSLKLALKKRK